MQGQLGEMRSQRELMADQLEEIRRDRKIQRLNMEMDKLVGQLKSRLEDKDIFPKNFEPITSRIKGSIRESSNDRMYEQTSFWQGIKQYKYLASFDIEFDMALTDYLNILFDPRGLENSANNANYKSNQDALKEAVKTRYNRIRRELLELHKENDKPFTVSA